MKLNEQDLSRILNLRTDAGLARERLQSIVESGSTITTQDLKTIDRNDLAAIQLAENLQPWSDSLAEHVNPLAISATGRKTESLIERIRGRFGLTGTLSAPRLMPLGALGAALLVFAVMVNSPGGVEVPTNSPIVAGSDQAEPVLFDGNFESLASQESIFSSDLEGTTDTVLFRGGFETPDQTNTAVILSRLETGNT